jgi:hypothetical protein
MEVRRDEHRRITEQLLTDHQHHLKSIQMLRQLDSYIAQMQSQI